METCFNVSMHFVVAPDRHYRVELRPQKLYFLKIGSQYDMQHPGSLGRGKMTGAATRPAARVSRWKLISAGLGTIIGSIGLFFLVLRFGYAVEHFFVLTAFGFVLLIAGCVAPARPYASSSGSDPDAALAAHKHNFAVMFSDIQTATLLPPPRPGRAGGLHLRLATGRTIKAVINSEEDLAIIQSALLPALGHRVVARAYNTTRPNPLD